MKKRRRPERGWLFLFLLLVSVFLINWEDFAVNLSKFPTNYAISSESSNRLTGKVHAVEVRTLEEKKEEFPILCEYQDNELVLRRGEWSSSLSRYVCDNSGNVQERICNEQDEGFRVQVTRCELGCENGQCLEE